MKNALTLLLLLPLILHAQEKESAHQPKIRGAIMMANSHIPAAENSTNAIDVLPAWGIDLDYFFHKRWSVAFITDIKLQDYSIVEANQVTLERKYPLSLCLGAHYHLVKNWSFYFAPGIELAKDENLLLYKLGTEYSFEITENFEIALNLIYENRYEVYDGFTFGIAFNKVLWRK